MTIGAIWNQPPPQARLTLLPGARVLLRDPWSVVQCCLCLRGFQKQPGMGQSGEGTCQEGVPAIPGGHRAWAAAAAVGLGLG